MTSDQHRDRNRPRSNTGSNARPGHSGPRRPAEPEKPGLLARSVAAKILSAVVGQKTPLDGMIDEHHGNAAFRELPPADRALVRAMLNSCLRHLTWIDAIFDGFLETPLPDGARHLHHTLAIAAAQILFLDIPDHSAVDLAVEQARRDPRSSRFANLVNALLRRLVREKETVLDGPRARIPVFPDWFQDRLEAVYGPDVTWDIGNAYLAMAPIDLTVKDRPEHWATVLGGTVLPTGTVRLDKFNGSVSELEGYADGAWWVQDAAAAIPARLMGDISGKRVADLCAAPGGKTAQLIVQGANVTAVEQSASRIKRLKSNLDRLGLTAEIHQDRLEDFEPAELFDALLLDAPCSSTGTIRRHPDVVWTKGPDDVAKLAGIQYDLLESSLGLLKAGGIVVFSNCSLDPLEGETLVEKLLAAHPEVERVPIAAEQWPGLEQAITDRGEFRTTPAMLGGMDGFYAAVLRKS